MSLVIEVKFIAGTYSGTGEGNSHFPPSPGRLLAALVDAAERSGNPIQAQKVVREIAAANSPEIVVPPAFSSGRTIGYMSETQSVEPGSKAKTDVLDQAQDFFGERGGKIAKHVNGHFAVVDPLYFLWPDWKISPQSMALLNELCRDIPYLGRECDLTVMKASVRTATEIYEKYRDTHNIYAPRAGGTIRLRASCLSYLDWLYERYESMFGEEGRAPIAANHQVKIERYAQTAPIPASDLELRCVPFARPMNLDRAKKYVPVTAGGKAWTSFLLARASHPNLDGKAVGIGVFLPKGLQFNPDLDPSILGEGSESKTLQPSFWTRRAKYWMTSVPFVAHPDKWVATQQVLAQIPEAEILELSSSPIRPSQSTISTDSKHNAWHISLKTLEEVSGPLILDAKAGTGVLIPDYRAKGVRNGN